MRFSPTHPTTQVWHLGDFGGVRWDKQLMQIHKFYFVMSLMKKFRLLLFSFYCIGGIPNIAGAFQLREHYSAGTGVAFYPSTKSKDLYLANESSYSPKHPVPLHISLSLLFGSDDSTKFWGLYGAGFIESFESQSSGTKLGYGEGFLGLQYLEFPNSSTFGWNYYTIVGASHFSSKIETSTGSTRRTDGGYGVRLGLGYFVESETGNLGLGLHTEYSSTLYDKDTFFQTLVLKLTVFLCQTCRKN